MSRAMENRAAVFTNQPQGVEVYQDGVWWPGSLLGWRHDTHGSCQVWVRIRIGGSESTTWTALEALRLPSAEQERPVGSTATESWGPVSPSGAPDPAVTRELQRIGSSSERRVRSAPEPRVVPAVEESVVESVPSWRAAAARTEQVATPGRHRAPAASGAGRHRAADTEAFAAVTDSTVRQRMPWPTTVENGWSVAVEEPWPASAERAWAPQTEPDSDVFTRPLRLNPVASRSASPRRGAAWDARHGGA